MATMAAMAMTMVMTMLVLSFLPLPALERSAVVRTVGALAAGLLLVVLQHVGRYGAEHAAAQARLAATAELLSQEGTL